MWQADRAVRPWRRYQWRHNTPNAPDSTAHPVQNSPRTPKRAPFCPFDASRENFVPLEPPTTRAGRTLYRIRDHVRDKTLPAHPSQRPTRYKTLPAHPSQRPTRYKTLPAHPSQRPTRYKTLPAHRKTPILGHLTPAGRTLYRSSHQQPEQGELYPACTSWLQCPWAAGPALSKIACNSIA